MNPFRCSNCDKLLGMIEGNSRIEIKCPKCKEVNRTFDDEVRTIDADTWKDKFKIEY